jgi:glutamate 5-kinase
VALLLDARLLVLLTDTAGLHTADPRRDPDAALIERVDDPDELGGYAIGDRTSQFGSGGMRSKVGAAEMASSSGIPAVITDGTASGTLRAAAAGEPVGTRFAAHPERVPSFKLWLRYAKPAKGRVVVDDGAARVLREQGSSLLPVGVVAVEGEFEAGDAVDVVCDGEFVGKGIVNYSAGELARIKGLKSADVLALLPNASEEAVHRDRFVLT